MEVIFMNVKDGLTRYDKAQRVCGFVCAVMGEQEDLTRCDQWLTGYAEGRSRVAQIRSEFMEELREEELRSEFMEELREEEELWEEKQ